MQTISHQWTRAAEILLVFAVALLVIAVGWTLVGEDPLARQAVVWIANVAMLGTVWLGLWIRGQGWAHFGLRIRPFGLKALVRAVVESVVVLVVALAAFILGSIVMMNVGGAPEPADMSGYDYLRGNLPMLLLALAAVYTVSSFGEEVIYRGFLMNRLAELGGGTRTAWGASIAISAVVFGLVHFTWGIVGIVQTAFMGVALAVAYLVLKRNLWVLILTHAYVDTLLLVQLYLGTGTGG
jgi:uncharacterized protein